MAMREEKADLRGKMYILEKEKKSLELTISSQNAQEVAMKTHIQHLQDELENQDSLVRINLYKRMLRLSTTKILYKTYNKFQCILIIYSYTLTLV